MIGQFDGIGDCFLEFIEVVPSNVVGGLVVTPDKGSTFQGTDGILDLFVYRNSSGVKGLFQLKEEGIDVFMGFSRITVKVNIGGCLVQRVGLNVHLTAAAVCCIAMEVLCIQLTRAAVC